MKSAQAQLEKAQASLDQARVNLSQAHRPVMASCSAATCEVGQTVAAGLQAPTLFVIARSLDVLQLDARVDEADVGRCSPVSR